MKRHKVALRSTIPAEVARWHSKENTTTAHSFYSPGRSLSTSVQNEAFFIWIVAVNSWRIPQKRLAFHGSRSVPFPHFHEGAVTRHNSMLGNGSHMESLLPFCRNTIKKSIRKTYTATLSCQTVYLQWLNAKRKNVLNNIKECSTYLNN